MTYYCWWNMGVPLEAKQQFIQCCLSEHNSAENIIAMDFGNKEGPENLCRILLSMSVLIKGGTGRKTVKEAAKGLFLQLTKLPRWRFWRTLDSNTDYSQYSRGMFLSFKRSLKEAVFKWFKVIVAAKLYFNDQTSEFITEQLKKP